MKQVGLLAREAQHDFVEYSIQPRTVSPSRSLIWTLILAVAKRAQLERLLAGFAEEGFGTAGAWTREES